jgi:hypothetical protein
MVKEVAGKVEEAMVRVAAGRGTAVEAKATVEEGKAKEAEERVAMVVDSEVAGMGRVEGARATVVEVKVEAMAVEDAVVEVLEVVAKVRVVVVKAMEAEGQAAVEEWEVEAMGLVALGRAMGAEETAMVVVVMGKGEGDLAAAVGAMEAVAKESSVAVGVRVCTPSNLRPPPSWTGWPKHSLGQLRSKTALAVHRCELRIRIFQQR